ncbi:SigE family RNA polymerase sigma factor [Saccharothrix luteola]|uniref:SigE family RNA polymerase sigma factor n=1 Tax=Saccharothrix luteola TaxID=2893018 RepID=UPI001E5B1DDF|nr:SigE family RNA polymerase sigma factor [Saccharothrix luteola]MCC8248255.1 SigE family RNA polymerase sigma factor [Saccharothrix luteola]
MFFRRSTGGLPDARFEEFVRAQSPTLLRLALLLVNDRGHAEDLLQTALLRTALRWHRVLDHPEAYARQVVVNLARDRWRRVKRRVGELPLNDLVAPPAPGDHARTVVDQQAVRQAVAALPQRQREVVVLRFFADLSVAETAQTMGTTEGTVKSQTHRALSLLRQSLDGSETFQEANDVH